VKNLSAQFEKKNEILRRGGRPPLLRMTRLRYFSEASIHNFYPSSLTPDRSSLHRRSSPVILTEKILRYEK
jgi:hypothetical protein